jgi:hypothetical protein
MNQFIWSIKLGHDAVERDVEVAMVVGRRDGVTG